ncbi:3-isopropylmalate dehydratase [Roseiterribacter gracilis]|uniref:3-isopropylmalate dehydratase small subunit n=1 Tax=Roseiterribacter gracilis TaxID=2812848 RepID=A0A8S8XHD4_9PROT|nr:3-isopropylmalate dehydratase small subunit [Rhodospirillales bacterium TMPK1]
MISGRAWKFGDGIDTDVLAPGHYMKLPLEEAATHCLEAIAPNFAKEVRPGDVVVGGASFGIGSSREQAAQALKQLGVGAVLATSFARIFYRNALNLGLPALFFPQANEIRDGDAIEVDPVAGIVRSNGREFRVEPIPAHLMVMIEDGGLMPHLKKKLARA